MLRVEIYIDGGCRNNGQPDAEAYGSAKYLVHGGRKKYKPEKKTFDFPDLWTSNQAEVATLTAAVKKLEYGLLSLEGADRSTPIMVYTDSQNLIGWLCENWKRKDATLRAMLAEADNVIAQFPNLRIEKVPREVIVEQLGH